MAIATRAKAFIASPIIQSVPVLSHQGPSLFFVGPLAIVTQGHSRIPLTRFCSSDLLALIPSANDLILQQDRRERHLLWSRRVFFFCTGQPLRRS